MCILKNTHSSERKTVNSLVTTYTRSNINLDTWTTLLIFVSQRNHFPWFLKCVHQPMSCHAISAAQFLTIFVSLLPRIIGNHHVLLIKFPFLIETIALLSFSNIMNPCIGTSKVSLVAFFVLWIWIKLVLIFWLK